MTEKEATIRCCIHAARLDVTAAQQELQAAYARLNKVADEVTLCEIKLGEQAARLKMYKDELAELGGE